MINRLLHWLMNETVYATILVSLFVTTALMLYAAGFFFTLTLGIGWFVCYAVAATIGIYRLLRPYVADVTEYRRK